VVRDRLGRHALAGRLIVISNWLAFAVLVYGLGVGAHWWPGPIATYRGWRARRAESLADEQDDEYGEYDDEDDGGDEYEDDDDPGPAPAYGSAARHARRSVTHRDGHGLDIGRDMRQEGDTAAETPLDTRRDRGHRNPSPRVWTRVRQAVDLVRGAERDTPTHLSDVPPAPPRPRRSPSVTGEANHGPGPDVASMPPRVVVHYVEPGSWTGQVAGTGDDGQPVVIRYMTRSAIAAPTEQLARPAPPEPEPCEQASSDALPIDEITVRREWLRTMTASGRFTPEEIRDLYVAKWQKTPKTLTRDLAAIADTDADVGEERGRR
jgi:hypothetical protein